MTDYNTGRALFACNALVYLAIAFGALSFWSDAFSAGGPIDYLVACLLTVAFGSVSFLLSGVVTRFAEAKDHGANFTAGAAIVLGIVLCLIEGGMTHQGLHWLDARKDIAPDWLLVVASFGLSVFNVWALYVFAREIPKKTVPASAASQLANARWKKAA
jgi:hypothetical protein